MARLQKPQLPLSKRVIALRGKRTQEEVAFAVQRETGRKLTPGTISQIENARIHPEPETIEALMRVLGQDPMQIPEYQLAIARDQLDERKVGLDVAMRNLELARAILPTVPATGGHPRPPGELGRRATGSRPKAPDRGREPKGKAADGH